MINGKGVLTWADGKKYEGNHKNDMAWGKGTLTFPNGDRSVGRFKNDEPEGKHILYSGDREYEVKYKYGVEIERIEINEVDYNKEYEEIKLDI